MFFLAMALHPDAQSRVQREIDSVVGMGGLPDFGNEKSLALRLSSRRSDAMVPCRAAAPVGAHYPALHPSPR